METERYRGTGSEGDCLRELCVSGGGRRGTCGVDGVHEVGGRAREEGLGSYKFATLAFCELADLAGASSESARAPFGPAPGPVRGGLWGENVMRLDFLLRFSTLSVACGSFFAEPSRGVSSRVFFFWTTDLDCASLTLSHRKIGRPWRSEFGREAKGMGAAKVNLYRHDVVEVGIWRCNVQRANGTEDANPCPLNCARGPTRQHTLPVSKAPMSPASQGITPYELVNHRHPSAEPRALLW